MAGTGARIDLAAPQAAMDASPKETKVRSANETARKVEIWVGTLIPYVVLVGGLGYSIYVMNYYLCVRLLFNQHRHTGAGIAILTVYWILVLLSFLPLFRLFGSLAFQPGFIPHRRNQSRSRYRTPIADGVILNRTAVLDGEIPAPDGLSYFYNKTVFVCDVYGLPLYCDACKNWKPDRTHHASKMNRCVSRMDHYCPWVGGVISETNMKFFVQFSFFATLWCAFNLAVMVWVVVRLSRNARFIVLLAFGAFFGVMSFMVAQNWVWLTFCNKTTIENSSKGCTLAVFVPDDHTLPHGTPIRTYPLRPDGTRPRTFALLTVEPGVNIWDLGAFENFKSIMGNSWYDWFTPVRLSPCCDHSSEVSHYPLGHEFERLKRERGIARPDVDDADVLKARS